jgi:hypothetical protein
VKDRRERKQKKEAYGTWHISDDPRKMRIVELDSESDGNSSNDDDDDDDDEDGMCTLSRRRSSSSSES